MTAESHKTTVVISQCQIFDLVFTTTCLSRPIVHTQTCFCHIEGHCIKYHYFQKDKFLFIISSFLKFTEGITHFKIIVTIGSFSMYILVKIFSMDINYSVWHNMKLQKKIKLESNGLRLFLLKAFAFLRTDFNSRCNHHLPNPHLNQVYSPSMS